MLVLTDRKHVRVGGKAVFKDYNLSRHYETKQKHVEKYKNLTDAERARTSEALLANLQEQQGFFAKLDTSRDAATKTSFVISHKIAKNRGQSSQLASDRQGNRTF
ncbi:general transcription factor II-I repeat domain-containing protein 2-like [Scomber scombrus]|uniref:General transcription factor II-I repeat domain-containing protein 2-like n=1 Tax=Scomber scombrus TaxID=13677 RepID=A0AAV1NWR6_SCOSC